MFKTKFERNYQKELRREVSIQENMKKYNCDRVRAVHQYDYDQEIKRQNFWSKI